MANKRLPNSGPGFEAFKHFPCPDGLSPNREIYMCGSGPPVLVLHESSGATPELFRFAYRLANAQPGFTVYVPVLFGQANQELNEFQAIAQLARLCLSREFAVLAEHRSSPIVDWLRSLAGAIHATHSDYEGVGAVGLCLTGSFALSMMLDTALLAPVVSEPALPFSFLPKGRRAIHLSDAEVTTIQQRVAEGAEILAFRFERDWLSPAERYANLERTFSPGVSGDRNLARTCPGAHSVFTKHFDETPTSSTAKALQDVIVFLQRKLHSPITATFVDGEPGG